MKKKVLSLVLVVLLIMSMAAYAAEETIVDIAVGDGSFTVLVAALQKAELVDTLSGEGPFTVFAPTDDAFTELLTALGITADDLLNHPQLKDVLLYHVVSGNVMSTDLSDGMSAETLKGDSVAISLDGGVFVDESQVVTADIEGTNGVIHVIDKVLVPTDFVLDSDDGMTDMTDSSDMSDMSGMTEMPPTGVAAPIGYMAMAALSFAGLVINKKKK